MEYIDIDKNEIPYRFEIDLAGEVFTLEIHYNYDFDFFTVSLEKGEEKIVDGEKVLFMQPLFSSISDIRLPKVKIIPRAYGSNVTRVGWDELGKDVFLMVEPLGV